MAKKQKPSADDADAPAEEAKGGGKKKLVIIAVAVLALGGGGGWFFLKKPAKDAQAPETKRTVAFVDMQEMTVNLASEPNQVGRFLKLKVALEVKDPKTVSEVQPLLPRVQDIFQVFVRELRPADLEGSGGVYRLREELLRRVNIAIFPNKADAVLFKEVIVQ